ncbi:MAG: PEP/pyruvate-binding domain-containing protein, partial [Acidimicrobiales bacterium]
LGESVVGGEVTPDLFEVNKVTGHVHNRMLGSKLTEHYLSADNRAVEPRPVDDDRRGAWSLTDGELEAVVALGCDLERKLGKGLDAEWAIGKTAASDCADELFALQVRPITVDPRTQVLRDQPGKDVAHNPIEAVLGRLSGREG